MTTEPTKPSTAAILGSAGMTLVGVPLALYAALNVASAPGATRIYVIYVLLIGMLSIIAALGYWHDQRWGSYVHLVAAVGQLAFPGTLFAFEPNPFSIFAIASTFVSWAILIGMAIYRRKRPSV